MLLGKWLLNGVLYRVVVRTDWENGKGHGRPPKGKDAYGLIEIGVNSEWVEVVDGLLHEAMELVITEMGFAYGAPIGAFHSSAATRTFFLNHEAYTEIMTRVSDFIMPILTGDRPLEKAWCKHHKLKVRK
jgi:hypothetical protein